jgi:hypothetical protein
MKSLLTNNHDAQVDEQQAKPARRFSSMRSLTFVCWSVAALVALLQLISKYAFIDPDGLSYLDIAAAYSRGDWHNAINAYWSPLFSWLLVLAMGIIRPSPYWEFTTVHVVNYAIFIGALPSFNFFLNELRGYQTRTSGQKTNPVPERLTLVVSYGIFLWVSLGLITVVRPTPDLLVSLLVYLAAGLTLRLCSRTCTWRTAAVLGVVLGLGYLAKAAMLPVGCAFLLTIFLATVRTVGFRTPLYAAVVVFVLIATPFILTLSLTKHRITFGDSGRLNYSWSVNKNTLWLHWQGDVPGSGTPIHPTRKLLDKPALYEFGQPIDGTFPPWYDPTYWYEGVNVYFDLRQQLDSLAFNLNRTVTIFYYTKASKIISFLCLIWLTISIRDFDLRRVWHSWIIILPSLLAMLMYALIIVVPRYVAPFVAILVITVLSGINWPESKVARRVAEYLTLAVLLGFLVTILWQPVERTYKNFTQLAHGEEPNQHWQIASYLHSIGIKPGDKVASVGYSFLPAWSRLARTKVVSEIPSAELFLLTPEANSKINQIFATTGAQVVVATPVLIREDPDLLVNEDAIPPEILKRTPPPVGWQRIPDSDVYVYDLRQLQK